MLDRPGGTEAVVADPGAQLRLVRVELAVAVDAGEAQRGDPPGGEHAQPHAGGRIGQGLDARIGRHHEAGAPAAPVLVPVGQHRHRHRQAPARPPPAEHIVGEPGKADGERRLAKPGHHRLGDEQPGIVAHAERAVARDGAERGLVLGPEEQCVSDTGGNRGGHAGADHLRVELHANPI